MNILALDLATKVGYAAYEDGKIKSGVHDLSRKKGERVGVLFSNFNRWLEECTWPKPDLIVYEQAHHRGGPATIICVGLTTRVEEFCYRYYLRCETVHSRHLKRFATGSGNASKADMILSANGWLINNGIQSKSFVTDDNESDAICLLWYAIEKFGGSACPQGSVPSASQKLESTTAGG